MRSTLTLEIEVEHTMNLPLDAAWIAAYTAQNLARTLLGNSGGVVERVGDRGQRCDAGDGDHVAVTVRSAFITSARDAVPTARCGSRSPSHGAHWYTARDWCAGNRAIVEAVE